MPQFSPISRTAPSPRLDRDRQAAPQVFERLREAITALELTPGTVLSRTEIAAQFGISQTPVRDALMRLDKEGLVEIYPQHATVVSPIDVNHAEQAHFLRRSLELEIVRTLALDTPPTLAASLTGAIAQQEAAARVEDFETFSAMDRLFHRTLYEAAGMSELWLLVRSRSGHIDRLRRLHLPTPGKAQEILHDHQRILAAIISGNAVEAQDHLRDHLSGTLAHVAQIRAAYPAYIRG
ncbi:MULTISPECIES: GntR family transcriptional regulator [Rhodomicrobium]|uniref:GntR family transcriptional regulator n=1 Tax=Rhodomicrobium TaxID=1068 RepID=UPI000B4B1DDE|nr:MULTISPECIES: GntR family transcriptional regulator [Rhodomicrobium]